MSEFHNNVDKVKASLDPFQNAYVRQKIVICVLCFGSSKAINSTLFYVSRPFARLSLIFIEKI